MLRLCSDSSRSYPGRSASRAIVPDGAAAGNGCRDEAEVSKSHSRRGRRPLAIGRLETSRGRTPEALPRRRAERRMGRSPNELS